MLIVSGVLYRRSTAALERAGGIADVAMRAQVSGRLEAINQVKGQAIERYFANIDKQIVTFSQNGMVVDAMTRFSEHFVSYAPGLHLSDDRLAEMRAELERYYVDQFAVEYASQNDGATIDARALLRGLDDETMLLQWSYIAANPHPLGEKHNLDSMNDEMPYSLLHRQVHPVVRSYLKATSGRLSPSSPQHRLACVGLLPRTSTRKMEILRSGERMCSYALRGRAAL